MYGTVCAFLVLGTLRSCGAASPEPLNIALNTRKTSHILDEHFVSMTLNPTDILQGRPFGMGTNTTLVILQGLAPAYIRFGGPDTNRYIFKSQKNADSAVRTSEEYAITEEHWKNLNEFMRRAGMDVVVCLNSGHRGGAFDKWDPRNALELITYSDKLRHNVTWELGYEPTREENMDGTQFGKDISQLRAILNAFPRYHQAKIVGPDVRVLHRKQDVDQVLDVLIEAGPAIDAVTWHPRWPHVSSITPSDTSEDGYDFPPDYLEWDRNQLHKLLQRTLLKKPFWISEPKAENKGSFAEGLIFARRLALAAKLGIEVVMKQPSLQDIAHPKPEYWVALLHKKTLGRTILDSRSLSNHSEVSLVVQCTSKTYGHGQDGGVTVLAVNTAGVEQRAVVRGLTPGLLGETFHQYVLTAGKDRESIFSQMAYLNGEPLLMTEKDELPDLNPKIKHLGQNLYIKLPPYSAGFWVVPQAKVKICQDEPHTTLTFDLKELNPTEVLKTTQKGINNLRNMNQILVEKLLNPTMSGEEEEEDEDTDTGDSQGESKPKLKRAYRQASITDLGSELKKRADEIRELMNLNVNGLGRRTVKNSDSGENHLRAAETKIDGLAEDLSRIINGASQEKEFGKFLEVSGLKTDFGTLMMDDRLAKRKNKPTLDDEFELDDSAENKGPKRAKRQLNSNNLNPNANVKDRFLDLAEIEKRYQKILAKYKKTLDHPKKISKMDLGKINKEVQEELLLKEITLLEKTEETLSEVMKNHQERQEAVEEMLLDELEEIKGEKLAALVEIKSHSTRKDDVNVKSAHFHSPNHLEREWKDEEKIPTKKRETTVPAADSEPKTEESKKEDPLNVIKNFLLKRKEEFSKRTHLQEKLLEMRNKLKLEVTKGKDGTTKAPTTTSETTETAAKETTTAHNTEKPTVNESLKNGEKRRSQVLKYMSEYIDQIHSKDGEGSSNEAADEDDNFPNRKPRKIDSTIKESSNNAEEPDKTTVASIIIKRILDALIQSNNGRVQTFQDPPSHFSAASTTETNTQSEPTFEASSHIENDLEKSPKEPSRESESKDEKPNAQEEFTTVSKLESSADQGVEAEPEEEPNASDQLEETKPVLEKSKLQVAEAETDKETNNTDTHNQQEKPKSDQEKPHDHEANVEPEKNEIHSRRGEKKSKDTMGLEAKESNESHTTQEASTTSQVTKSKDRMGLEADKSDESHTTQEATTTPQITKSKEERTRRATDVTDDPSTLTQEVDLTPYASSEELLTNTIVKKQLPKKIKETPTNTEITMLPSDVLDLAGSTVKVVLDKVIPRAYGQAKDKIESLGLPDYIQNLGKMVENLQHIDTVLKDVGDIAKRASNSPSEHIQKIERTKRETEASEESDKTSDQNGNTEPPQLYAKDKTEMTNEREENTAETTLHYLAATESFQDGKFTTPPTLMTEHEIEEIWTNDTTFEKALDQALDKTAEELLQKEIEARVDMNKLQQETMEEKKIKAFTEKTDKLTSQEGEDDDPISPRLADEQIIMHKIIENLLQQQKDRAEAIRGKGKRQVPNPVYLLPTQRNGYKRETLEPVQSSYGLQTPEEEPAVSQFLRKLRPGVYVVPSKDMANVHAEQTARAAATPKSGKHMPNVLTLNIYYDKKEVNDKKNEAPPSYENEPMAPADTSTGQQYRYSSNQWPADSSLKPLPPPPPPVLPPQSGFPSLRKPYDFQYPTQVVPQPSYPSYRAPQLLQKYSRGYTYPTIQKPYNEEYIYEEPQKPAVPPPAPKLIPISPFKPQPEPQATPDTHWQLTEKDETESGEVEKEDNVEASDKKNEETDTWYLRKASDEPPVYVRKELSKGGKKEKEFTFSDKKKSIEPYWNRTLREIFQETAQDSFWKFLEEPDSKSYKSDFENGSDEKKTFESGAEQTNTHGTSRKKRSLEYASPYMNNNEIQFDTKPFSKVWLTQTQEDSPYNYYVEQQNLLEYNRPDVSRFRRSMLDNLITKERAPERYPLESDRIVHKILPRKQLKKLTDPDSSLEMGGPVTSFQLVSPQVVLTPSNPSAQLMSAPNIPIIMTTDNTYSSGDYFTYPINKIYEIAVDLIRRMMTSDNV